MYFGCGCVRSAAQAYALRCWSVWSSKRDPCHHVDGLDRFERRGVHRIGAVEVSRACAVNACIVAPTTDPVEDNLNGTGRIGGERASADRCGNSRHHGWKEHLVIPAKRHGEAVQSLCGHIGAHIGPVGLQGRCLSRYRQAFRDLADGQRNVHSGDVVDRDDRAGLRIGLKARRDNLDGVRSRCHRLFLAAIAAGRSVDRCRWPEPTSTGHAS